MVIDSLVDRYFISCSCRAIEVVALVGHLLILDSVISSFLNFIFAAVRDSGVLGDSQAPEFLNSSVQAESHTSKTSTTKTANCLETSDQVEELKPVKAVEHETSTRIPHALDSETAKPLETSNQMKGLEMVKPLEYETSTHISQQSLVSQI
ncbi:hypothetical protein NE237_009994 [Protea cynaroides]|uniref:Uncharacterized protein n=1 Tax=Protea cynaroides TaxID=273540 RepID=A0A9Q0R162_9MAGN|nr:hypothetical protein NE237_009994 [Protea cynaroides]